MFETRTFGYEEAVRKMQQGFIVYRKGWSGRVIGIFSSPLTQHVQTLSSYGMKNWEPYFVDFWATDWVVRKPEGFKK